MRRADWLAQLTQQINASIELPFEYGSHDCCIFAAKCVDAMTDGQIAEHLREAYADRRTAVRFLASFDSLRDAVTAHVGEPMTNVLMASRGDVVLFEDSDQYALGVCIGAQFVAASNIGVVYHPMTRVTHAWKVE